MNRNTQFYFGNKKYWEAKKAIRKWLDDYQFNTCLTLTLNQNKYGFRSPTITEFDAEVCAKHIINKLNKEIYKSAYRRKKIQMNCFFVLEGQNRHRFDHKRLHLHAALNVPDSFYKNNHVKRFQIIQEICKSEMLVREQMDVRAMDKGFIDYILKEGTDAILPETIRLSPATE